MAFTPHRQLRNARALRRDETSAEALLWSRLRARRLNGFKFVRQAPVGPFIVDFLCREARLVVEVDGATHSEDREVAYDRRREAALAADGHCVVRVQNDDVYRRLDAVLETILAALEGRA
jgi:very-short-patch-repair endonuclease